MDALGYVGDCCDNGGGEMTDAPKTIWAGERHGLKEWDVEPSRDDRYPYDHEAEYVLASHAEAEKREAVNAALERAADCAHSHLPRDYWEARDSTPEYNAACRDIAKAIRAMKEEQ